MTRADPEAGLRRSGTTAIPCNEPPSRSAALTQPLIQGAIKVNNRSHTAPPSLKPPSNLAEALGTQAWIGTGTVSTDQLTRESKGRTPSRHDTPNVQQDVATCAAKHPLGFTRGPLTAFEIATTQGQGSKHISALQMACTGAASPRAPLPHAKVTSTRDISHRNLDARPSAPAIGVEHRNRLPPLDGERPDGSAVASAAPSLVAVTRPHTKIPS